MDRGLRLYCHRPVDDSPRLSTTWLILEYPALKEVPAGSPIDAQPPASHWHGCRRYNTKSSISCADKVPLQGGMRPDFCTASPPSAIAIENSTGQIP